MAKWTDGITDISNQWGVFKSKLSQELTALLGKITTNTSSISALHDKLESVILWEGHGSQTENLEIPIDIREYERIGIQFQYLYSPIYYFFVSDLVQAGQGYYIYWNAGRGFSVTNSGGLLFPQSSVYNSFPCRIIGYKF